VSALQSAVVPAPVVALPVVESLVAAPLLDPALLPGPDLAAAASREVSWPLALLPPEAPEAPPAEPPAEPPACPKDAVEMPRRAAATAAPSNFMFMCLSSIGWKKVA
jgi:hypothetical protein